MKTPLFRFLVLGFVMPAIDSAAQPAVDWNDSLSRLVQDCAALHIPAEALENKIREGHAKKRSGKEIFDAVTVRKKLLLRIRDGNNGVMPDAYGKRLFELEREALSVVPATAVTGRSNPASRHHQSVVAAPRKTENLSERSGITPPDASPADGTDSSGQDVSRPEIRKNSHRQAAERAEKSAEKAAQKALRRMEMLQQRLQKKAMNRHGNGR